jgi:uncharacterized protein
MTPHNAFLDLYDYRKRVAQLYERRNRLLSGDGDPVPVLAIFRMERDDLFRSHPQSALDSSQLTAFDGLDYFPHNPSAAVRGELQPARESAARTVTIDEGDVRLVPVAKIHFVLDNQSGELTLFWIDVYGGGLFLPFADATALTETYGGGRYLIDTAKGSDFPSGLNRGAAQVTLDFNYAYNPSCAYNSRWTCPLTPRENRLAFPIRAGEKKFEAAV